MKKVMVIIFVFSFLYQIEPSCQSASSIGSFSSKDDGTGGCLKHEYGQIFYFCGSLVNRQLYENDILISLYDIENDNSLISYAIEIDSYLTGISEIQCDRHSEEKTLLYNYCIPLPGIDQSCKGNEGEMMGFSACLYTIIKGEYVHLSIDPKSSVLLECKAFSEGSQSSDFCSLKPLLICCNSSFININGPISRFENSDNESNYKRFSLKILQNPVDKFIPLEIRLNDNVEIEILIIGIDGKIHYVTKKQCLVGKNNFDILVSGLSPNLYLLQVNLPKSSLTQKFIKY